MQPIFFKRCYVFLIFILTAILVGIIAVTYGEIFAQAVEIAQKRVKLFPYLSLVITPILFLLGAYICNKFAPSAQGSGTKNIIYALEQLTNIPAHNDFEQNKVIKDNLSFKIVIVKFVSSTICAFAGGALGREGPIVRIAASIFTIIGQKLKPIVPIDIRIWIIAGGAAGLAAAFNTPLAGIIFAIEELSRIHFSKFKINTLLAVVTAGITAQILSGSYSLFIFPAVNFH